MPALNLDVNYRDHIKTRRLVAMLGKDAEFAPVKLWLHTGKLHPEGRLKGYAAQEIEGLVDWSGTPGAFIEAMEKLDWLKKDASGNYVLAGWKEHQGHLVAYKVRGKKAAKARWDKALGKNKNGCYKHTTSNAQEQNSNAPTDGAYGAYGAYGANVTEGETNKGAEDFAIAPPPGFPESEDQAVFVGERSGVPKDRTLHFWNDLASKGWRDGNGIQIHDFGRYCKIRFDNETNKRAREAQPRPAYAQRPPTPNDMRTVVEAKKTLMTNIRNRYCSETASGPAWSDKEKRVEYFKIKKEVDELTERMAKLL